jgi:hypothetical protein
MIVTQYPYSPQVVKIPYSPQVVKNSVVHIKDDVAM